MKLFIDFQKHSTIEINDKKTKLKNALMLMKNSNKGELKVYYYNDQETCYEKLNYFYKLKISINKKILNCLKKV
jgi:hypothetical protein